MAWLLCWIGYKCFATFLHSKEHGMGSRNIFWIVYWRCLSWIMIYSLFFGIYGYINIPVYGSGGKHESHTELTFILRLSSVVLFFSLSGPIIKAHTIKTDFPSTLILNGNADNLPLRETIMLLREGITSMCGLQEKVMPYDLLVMSRQWLPVVAMAPCEVSGGDSMWGEHTRCWEFCRGHNDLPQWIPEALDERKLAIAGNTIAIDNGSNKQACFINMATGGRVLPRNAGKLKPRWVASLTSFMTMRADTLQPVVRSAVAFTVSDALVVVLVTGVRRWRSLLCPTH